MVETYYYMPTSSPSGTTWPLKSTWAPVYLWQHLGPDFFHFLWIWVPIQNWPLVQDTDCSQNPCFQMQCVKKMSIMKELFAKHRIQESVCADNGPQFANGLFSVFATKWKLDHKTSASTNPRGNSLAEATVNIVNGHLTCAKCSGQDPYQTILAYCRHTSWCTSVLPSRMSVPTGIMHHSTAVYMEHRLTCHSWLWMPWWTCLPECCISCPMSFKKEVPTLCWTACLCPQLCQEPVAPWHCHLWS